MNWARQDSFDHDTHRAGLHFRTTPCTSRITLDLTIVGRSINIGNQVKDCRKCAFKQPISNPSRP
ncbi:hypothetical protein HNQ96_003861 [Aminobacter lissarensis]|uniref:Uncharacterized protein n=1 Tax=Aminobacter carboxidus TaxID=376165 RepID=A0A8E2BDG9_9HYPH|nr:hypothetical protein [Aminobacter lissarensis]